MTWIIEQIPSERLWCGRDYHNYYSKEDNIWFKRLAREWGQDRATYSVTLGNKSFTF